MMRILDFARLVRLPNAFTALADIALGALVTAALPEQLVSFIFLVLASTSLYWAGMVWNDYFDLEQDKRERPFRPLPSGRVSTSAALALGSILLTLGLFFAALASRTHSLPLAMGLVSAIIFYDAWLKRTWAGPLAMGTCRFLNVLLGLSVSGGPPGAWGIALALVVGVYIAGVTWFARTEAAFSNRNMLLVGAGLMATGLLLALTVPPLALRDGMNSPLYEGGAGGGWSSAESPPLHPLIKGGNTGSILFPYLLAGFGFYVGLAVVRAIQHPIPQRVQAAVKRAVLGLVILDAILATGLAGISGLILLGLLLPAHFLGRWVYST